MTKNNKHTYKFTLFVNRLHVDLNNFIYNIKLDIANPCIIEPHDDHVNNETDEFEVSHALMHAVGLAEYIRKYGDIEFDSFFIDGSDILDPRKESKKSKYHFYNGVIDKLNKAIHKALKADQEQWFNVTKKEKYGHKTISVAFNPETKNLKEVEIQID